MSDHKTDALVGFITGGKSIPRPQFRDYEPNGSPFADAYVAWQDAGRPRIWNAGQETDEFSQCAKMILDTPVHSKDVRMVAFSDALQAGMKFLHGTPDSPADTDHPGLDLDEVLEAAGYSDIVEHGNNCLFGVVNALTRCPEGCEVEMDGHCPHGFASILIEAGLV